MNCEFQEEQKLMDKDIEHKSEITDKKQELATFL